MTIRYYILPTITVGGRRGPKYFHFGGPGGDSPGIDCVWSMKDYGSIDEAVLAADISDTDHATVSANMDVYSFPINLDTTMALAERSAANTFFEAHGIPGDWLKQGDTFRGVLRIVTAMFLYLQRVLALIGYPADPYAGLTLNTQYRNIPNPLHDALQAGAVSLGYTWTVGNNDQIRKIWKTMADAWGSTPILFGFTTL
jgi:hypothetical protein